MLEREMRFPYGISDFSEIRTEGYFYADRTDRIPLLERAKYLLFLRPRRFGKTLLLSTLAHYYDIALKDAYDPLFGSLAIGPNPTRLRNQYLILKWDFSCVDSFGQAEAMRQASTIISTPGLKAFAPDMEARLRSGCESTGRMPSIRWSRCAQRF